MHLRQRLTLAAGALYALFAVIAGAVAAHLLPATAAVPELARFETAASYQMYHALALLLIASLQPSHDSRLLSLAAACFALGVFVFSGSLYTRIFVESSAVAQLTPIGGILLMLGWLALLAAAFARD